MRISDWSSDVCSSDLMCNDTGMSLNFHLNAAMDPTALTWEGFAFEQTLSVVATMFSIGNAATLGNWIVSGRLDRHPKLKLGQIGRAHVCTPVTNAHVVCRPLLEKKKTKQLT